MKPIRISVSESSGEISAEIIEPKNMKAMMVLAHGAGAGMNHRFMVQLSDELSQRHIGTLRYNFPYMENGKKRPDLPAVAIKTVEGALNKAQELFPKSSIVGAGKSFGGRMTSQCLAKHSTYFVKGIIFFGFPLHPAGAPGIDRASHLKEITQPMLFLQGTRDALADLVLMKQVTSTLPKSTLILFEGADHSFKSGKKEFIPELVEATAQWIGQLR
jgi:predicted alpha/beta-hydrolase family hydrolase